MVVILLSDVEDSIMNRGYEDELYETVNSKSSQLRVNGWLRFPPSSTSPT